MVPPRRMYYIILARKDVRNFKWYLMSVSTFIIRHLSFNVSTYDCCYILLLEQLSLSICITCWFIKWLEDCLPYFALVHGKIYGYGNTKVFFRPDLDLVCHFNYQWLVLFLEALIVVSIEFNLFIYGVVFVLVNVANSGFCIT